MARLISVLAALIFVGACGGGDSGEAKPSGGEIAFTVNDTGWNEVWLMAADGSERRRLTEVEPPDNDAAGSMSPAWSPDRTQIAFAAQVGTREEDQRLTEIYVMRADGTDRAQAHLERGARRVTDLVAGRKADRVYPDHRTGNGVGAQRHRCHGRRRRERGADHAGRVPKLRPEPSLVA